MKALIFTCQKHMPAAEMAADVASKLMDVALVIDKSESHIRSKHPIILSSFDRAGNLSSTDAAIGVAQTMLDNIGSDSQIMKIDSDTIVKDITQFVGTDLSGFNHSGYPAAVYGCCYSISKRALEHVIPLLKNSRAMGNRCECEDVMITSYAQTLRKEDFKAHIIPTRKLGVWHPKIAPKIVSKHGNFGLISIKGNWCHRKSLEAMYNFAFIDKEPDPNPEASAKTQ